MTQKLIAKKRIPNPNSHYYALRQTSNGAADRGEIKGRWRNPKAETALFPNVGKKLKKML